MFAHFVTTVNLLCSRIVYKIWRLEAKKVGTLDREEKREGDSLNFYSSRMFEMAEPEVVQCQEHAYSIYGYFLYGWPFPPPWEPIGTLSYTSRSNVNSEKENTGITMTFYRSHILLPRRRNVT